MIQLFYSIGILFLGYDLNSFRILLFSRKSRENVQKIKKNFKINMKMSPEEIVSQGNKANELAKNMTGGGNYFKFHKLMPLLFISWNLLGCIFVFPEFKFFLSNILLTVSIFLVIFISTINAIILARKTNTSVVIPDVREINVIQSFLTILVTAFILINHFYLTA
jgi:hypothetical protein